MRKDDNLSDKNLKNGKIVKKIINGFNYYFPKLVNRKTTTKYSNKCIYCKSTRYRYFSSSFGKKYYQCENCLGIN